MAHHQLHQHVLHARRLLHRRQRHQRTRAAGSLGRRHGTVVLRSPPGLLLPLFLTAADKLVDRAYQRGLAYAQPAGALAHVRGPCYLVVYHRHALHYAAYRLRALHGVGHPLEQQVGLELYEVGLVGLYILAELLRRVLAGKAVGVVAVGQQQHLHVHPLGQQHVNAPHRGMYARRVAVVQHRYVARKAAYQAYLPRGERRARRRHHVLHPALVHRRHVNVALNQVAAVSPRYGLPRLVQAVQLAALVVYQRLGRVDILRRLLVAGKYAPAEGHHPARHRVHGEYHPARIPVLQAPVVPAVAQARVHQVLLLEAPGHGGPRQRVAHRQRIAQLELAYRVVAEAPRAQVLHAH